MENSAAYADSATAARIRRIGRHKEIPPGISTALLAAHMEAMFVLDGEGAPGGVVSWCPISPTSAVDGVMRAVNEPWDQTKPAPRLYVGALLDGAVRWLFGRGIPPGALPALESILRALADDAPGPVGVSALRDALAGLLPVLGGERRDTELCYRVPHLPTPAVDCALITEANIGQFALGPFGWLRDEITSAQPCAALVDKGRAVSICRSVRISPAAHEAGIETLPECRGQGLAGRALALWARAVRAVGAIPLYSTAWDNAASRRVAQKAGLALYASGFSIW